jgi:glutamine amidotransferase
MQLLFERSEELEPTDGLALLSGPVTAIIATQHRIPHIGWNEVSWTRPSRLTEGLPASGCPFYHVHSYAVRPTDASDVVGTTEYGEPFATVIEHGRVFGVQFHPEKSSRHGLELLGNFVRLCGDGEATGRRNWTAALSARG